MPWAQWLRLSPPHVCSCRDFLFGAAELPAWRPGFCFVECTPYPKGGCLPFSKCGSLLLTGAPPPDAGQGAVFDLCLRSVRLSSFFSRHSSGASSSAPHSVDSGLQVRLSSCGGLSLCMKKQFSHQIDCCRICDKKGNNKNSTSILSMLKQCIYHQSSDCSWYTTAQGPCTDQGMQKNCFSKIERHSGFLHDSNYPPLVQA